MRNLIFAVFAFILLAIGLIAVMNMQAEPTGLLIDKPFIPSSPIEDMAYSHLQDAISQNKTALIFFYDNTCDACISQIAEIETLMDYLNANNPNIFQNFTYYEYDFSLPDLRSKLDVTHHHTLILIKSGKEVLRTSEAVTKDELLGKIIEGG
jgi:hypothetical protein